MLERLRESDDPHTDQAMVLKSQLLFWLIGATDGHAKNFSLFLRPGGQFQLTPFYDVLSAQPAFDAKQISHRNYKLAMSVGASPHYKIADIHGRHFVETARAAGLGPAVIAKVLAEVRAKAIDAPEEALAKMPAGFPEAVHASIVSAIKARLPRLDSADELLRRAP